MLIIFIIIPKENHIEVCKKFGIFPSERRNHKKGNVQRNKRYIPEKNKENYHKRVLGSGDRRLVSKKEKLSQGYNFLLIHLSSHNNSSS